MSDLDQLTAMLTRAGIAHKIDHTDERGPRLRIDATEDNGGDRAGVDGYSGFYAEFMFEQDGSLALVGIWE